MMLVINLGLPSLPAAPKQLSDLPYLVDLLSHISLRQLELELE